MIEETEVTTDSESSDWWVTYQGFYLSQENIVLSEDLVHLIGTGMSAYHVLLDSGVGELDVTINIYAENTSHTLVSDDIKLLDTWHVWADSTEHELVSEVVTIIETAQISANGSFHDLFSQSPEICFGLVLETENSSHILESSEVSAIITTGGIELTVYGTIHQLSDSCWNDVTLVHTFFIDADNGRIYHLADGNLYIGNGNEVYPRSCCHELVSDEVSGLTFRRILCPIEPNVHFHTSEYIQELILLFTIDVDNCSHNLFSTVASPDFVHPFNSAIGITSSSPWNWMNNSFHLQEVEEVVFIVTVDVDSSIISFSLQPTISLIPIINVSDSYHSLFTSDKVPSVDSSFIEHFSTVSANNTRYRRLNV